MSKYRLKQKQRAVNKYRVLRGWKFPHDRHVDECKELESFNTPADKEE